MTAIAWQEPEPGATWRIATLANGLRLVVTPMPQSQAASLAIYVGVGSRQEARRTLGLSHYLEHMLFKGTESRPTAIEISTAIEGAGGTLNAFTTKELTCFWNRVPYDKLDLAMDILSDSVRHSLLAPEEVERERTVIQQEIRRGDDEPAQRASQLLAEAAYGDQPLGWDIAGDLASVAGNVDPDRVLAIAQRCWDDAPAGGTPAVSDAESVMGDKRALLEHRDIEQCNLGIALRTFPREDPVRYALSLLNEVLGRGMSSRLFVEVRERRGLAYSVGSGLGRFRDTGHLSIGAGVTRENLVETIEVTLAEVGKLTQDLVSTVELEKAREHALGSFRLSLETSQSHAHRTGDQLLTEGHIRTVDAHLDGLRAVTADDVRRVAQRERQPGNLALAVVGPFEDEARIAELVNA